jgi:S1-C subfamily serine protease
MKTTARLLLIALLAVAFVGYSADAKPKTAWMGVYTQTVDDDLAEAFDLKTDYGAIVNEVVKGSPADEAGLEEDDIIIKFNGERVWDSRELTDFVRDHNPGDEITLTVLRDGAEQELSLTLERRPASDVSWGFTVPRAPRAPRAPDAPEPPHIFSFNADPRGFVGVRLQNLNEQLGQYFGIENGDGVLVTEVEEESPAAEAGLKAGDVIVAVDGELIDDASDVREIVGDKREGDQVSIDVMRNKQKQSLAVTVEETDRLGYGHFQIPDLGDIQYYMPKMRDLYRGNARSYRLDPQEEAEWQRAMEEFKKEMEELKRELKDLRFEVEQQ